MSKKSLSLGEPGAAKKIAEAALALAMRSPKSVRATTLTTSTV
jgi:hypothetical protein